MGPQILHSHQFLGDTEAIVELVHLTLGINKALHDLFTPATRIDLYFFNMIYGFTISML